MIVVAAAEAGVGFQIIISHVKVGIRFITDLAVIVLFFVEIIVSFVEDCLVVLVVKLVNLELMASRALLELALVLEGSGRGHVDVL